ncbi:hypothetical protein CYMTET_35782 [Cymbomonas tetramitiformis]|uniref:Uncharacterized protein n=1 Tax=Cymbomonas tetramitiformis TaxID=36881 RepID=A0AAE0F8G4_9CHLO|nr:hypothetical protein CYMTET_35782 [Cymbomonas tetramitiformis]
MKVPKAVRQKIFESKEGRFSGTECHASTLFTRMVSALRTTFVTADIRFAPLFRLEDATLPIRVEANDLLFSTLELLGQSDMLGIRIIAGVDPHDAIGDFNATARTRATLLDEDMKALPLHQAT